MNKLSFPKFSLTGFFTSHYAKLIVAVLILLIAGAVVFLYTVTYDELISPKTVNPDDILLPQKKIDLETYQKVTNKLEEKAGRTAPEAGSLF